jgi:hypothetical protein
MHNWSGAEDPRNGQNHAIHCCHKQHGPASTTHCFSRLARTQRAGGIVEQLIDRHRPRNQLLLVAEIDDDLQNRSAGFDPETVRIERPTLRQTGGALSRNCRKTSRTASGRDRDSSVRITSMWLMGMPPWRSAHFCAAASGSGMSGVKSSCASGLPIFSVMHGHPYI